MEKTEFDTDKFISEIHSRPALWDTGSDDYANRDLKRKCWEDLVNLFLDKAEATAAEKNEFANNLQRKWKSLRDCYTREVQRVSKLKSGTAVPRKTQYIFFNQLSFLQKVVRNKNVNSGIEDFPLENHLEVSHEQPSGTPGVQFCGIKKRKVAPEVEQLMAVLNASIKSRERHEKAMEEDDDRLFMLSLVKQMKRIPEHLRLSVRVQILEVINKAVNGEVISLIDEQKQQQPNQHHQQYPQQYIFSPLQHPVNQWPATGLENIDAACIKEELLQLSDTNVITDKDVVVKLETEDPEEEDISSERSADIDTMVGANHLFNSS